MMAVAERSQRFYGLRVGRWFFVVKDMRLNKAYFSERNRFGVRRFDIGHWRFLVRTSRVAS